MPISASISIGLGGSGSVIGPARSFQLVNTFTGLCLDAPDGVGQGKKLTLGCCESLAHGTWAIEDDGTSVKIRNKEGTNADGSGGYCVDYYPNRTGRHPTLWECNGTDAQQFIRDPDTAKNRWSFMTKDSLQELAVEEGDDQGSLANFLPVSLHGSGRPKFEWVYYKK
ncbi:hypothetical protein BGX28_008034 [Mortierella sp. GBA30]|nr:hypothetical protein BGX28_008034 [Mortierella sp. GBA30]